MRPSIQTDDCTVAASRMWSVRTAITVIALLICGVLIGFSASRAITIVGRCPEDVVEVDTNNDGVVEIRVLNRNGKLTRVEEDRNSDGCIDVWGWYEEGLPDMVRSDVNFDGKPDETIYYAEGVQTRVELDMDRNGVVDVEILMTNGVPYVGIWRPNGADTILRKRIMKDGVLLQEFYDEDGDGRFDTLTVFDPMENVISRKSIALTSQVAVETLHDLPNKR